MAGEGPNTPDQLDIVQQMNKALQEQNKILQQIAGALGGQAKAAQDAAQANNKAAEAAKNNSDSSKELTESLKENTGGSEGLAAAMGKQAKTTTEASDTMSSFADKAGMATAALGALAAVQSGVKSGFAAVGGAVNLFSDGIMSMGGILQGAVGLVSSFFGGLMKAAADYYNKVRKEIFEANENIRDSFGDLSDNQGAAVKSMTQGLDSFKAAASAAGTSIFTTFGGTAQLMAALQEAAEGFGASFIALQDQVVGARNELLLMNKGMGVSYEAMKKLGEAAAASGGSLQDSLQEAMVASSHLSKTFGVDVKAIGKNFSAMAEDVETFGHLGPKALAATATYAAKLGVEVSALQGVMKGFDTFEDAAKNAGMLAEAFGMNIDAMAMMNAENPAERIDMLRASLQETGKSFEDLSRHEKQLMAQTMGMDMSSLTNAMSVDVDEMGFGDFEDAAEEAAQKITPEEAMADVAKSMKKLSNALTNLQGGPLSDFINGFKTGLERSEEFKAILGDIGDWLLLFQESGKKIGALFAGTFLKQGTKFHELISNIFNLEKAQAFLTTVETAFAALFGGLAKGENPGELAASFFDDMLKAFSDWIGLGGESKMGDFLIDLLVGAIQMVGGMAPKVIKMASKYIRDFAKSLGEFLNDDKGTKDEVAGGIGGALVEAFTAIKDTVVNDLGPALLELFGVLFDKFGPPLIAILGAVFTAIFIKSIVSAAMAAAAGVAVKAGVEILSQKLVAMAGGGIGSKKGEDAEKVAQSTQSTSEAFKGMLESLREIEKDDIKKVGEILFQMAIHLAKAMVVFAIGMVAVAAIMSIVPWNALAKGVVGMATAIMASIPMIAAAYLLKDNSESDWADMGKAMIYLAGLYMIGGVTLGLASILVAAVWNMVDVGGIIKASLLMGLIAITMLPVIGVVMLLGLIIDKALPIASIGLVGLAAMLIISMGLGLVMPTFAEIWGQVNLGGTMKGLLIMSTLATVMVGIVLGMLAIGAILSNPVTSLMTVAGLAGMTLILLAAGTYAEELTYPIKQIIDAFGKISLAGFIKAMFLMTGVAAAAVVMTVAGVALAALSPFMLVAAVGIGAMGAFIEFSAGALEQAITAIANIKLDNPDKTLKVIEAVGKVVKVMGDMADIGLKAAKMAIIASIFGGGEPADMMTSMSDFMTGTIDSIKSLIVTMVVMAGQFDEKALKGAEAIAGLIGAVAALAGAIMDPLIKVQENAGFFASGDEMAKQMEQMASSVGVILEKLQTYIPGIISALIGSLAGISDPEAFAQKASALKNIFEGILALAEVVQKFNEMGQKDAPGWFTGTEFDETTITSMFKNVSKVLVHEDLKNMINDASALVNGLGGEGILEKTKVFGDQLKGIITLTKDLASFGQFLATEGQMGLIGLTGSFAALSAANSMPSNVIGLITAEANKMATNLGNLEADLGSVALEPKVNAVLGYEADRTFTIKPEAVNLKLSLKVAIDAKELAVAIAQGNEDTGGFFETTVQAQNAGLDIPGGA